LTYIEDTLFSGTVTATIDAAGKIQVTDNTTGDSRLEIDLVTNNPAGGSLDFGTVSTSTEGRNMQLAAGEDAEIELDSVVLTLRIQYRHRRHRGSDHRPQGHKRGNDGHAQDRTGHRFHPLEDPGHGHFL
jgi:hypothetical protein